MCSATTALARSAAADDGSRFLGSAAKRAPRAASAAATEPAIPRAAVARSGLRLCLGVGNRRTARFAQGPRNPGAECLFVAVRRDSLFLVRGETAVIGRRWGLMGAEPELGVWSARTGEKSVDLSSSALLARAALQREGARVAVAAAAAAAGVVAVLAPHSAAPTPVPR